MNRVDGASVFAVDELIRRLAILVPANTALLNTKLSLTGNAAITIPVKFGIAPAVMTDAFVNGVYVSYEETLRDGGAGQFITVPTLMVYSIGDRISSPNTQTKDHGFRTAIIKASLYSLLNGCVDLAGNTLWTQLLPVQSFWIPEPYVEYSGVVVHYTMRIAPGANRWTNINI